MTGVDTGHIHVILLLVIQVARLGHRLIHPFGEVSIDGYVDILVVETVSQLSRRDLLVARVTVDGVGSGLREESTVVEFRRT